MAPEVSTNGNSTNGELAIIPKGLFHIDSFFEDFRNHFDTAVKEILDNFGGLLANTCDFESYKKLRELDFNEGKQAVSLTEDDANIKIALDVKDFTKGHVKVRVDKENQLLVEGNVESKEENSYFKKSFCRSFPIPRVTKSEDITSAISSDGILTVTVPKK